MPEHLPVATPEHERTRIVIQALERHTAEVAERPLVAIPYRLQALMRVGAVQSRRE